MRSKKSSAARGLKRRIGRAAYRNRERNRARKAANAARAKRRARLAHVFGDRKNSMGVEVIRTIGIVPARARSA
jgi:hypothetical protein